MLNIRGHALPFRSAYIFAGSAALLSLALFHYYVTRNPTSEKLESLDDMSQLGSRPGGTYLMNPWDFAVTIENIEEEKQQVESLLRQIYAAPIEEQEELAKQLASENKSRAHFMWYDAVISGHQVVASAVGEGGSINLNEAGTSAIFSQSIKSYLDSAKEEIWQATGDQKKELVQKFLLENPEDQTVLMFNAAVKGQAQVIEWLLDLNVPIHSEDEPSLVPLQAACFNGNLECAKLLHARGVPINHQDEFGGSPLMRAATAGHVDVIKWLLDSGADVNLKDWSQHQMNALVFAAWHGHKDVAQLLVERGSEYTSHVLTAAAYGGVTEIFESILELNNLPRLPSSNWNGAHIASEQFKLLVNALEYGGYGASPMIVRQILEYLVTMDHENTVEGDENAKSFVDALFMSLQNTAKKDSVETADIILQFVRERDQVQNFNGQISPSILRDQIDQFLPLCAESGASRLVQYLIEKQDAPVDSRRLPQHTTSLYVAASTGNVELIQVLVNKYSADIHQGNGKFANGPTALWKAIDGKQERAARELLQLGGPVEHIDEALDTSSTRVFVVASKAYRGPVNLTTEMSPSWLENDTPIRFLCLEYPDGIPFLPHVQIRKSDAELKDERELRLPD